MTGKNDIDTWMMKEVQLPNNNVGNLSDAYSFIFEGVIGTSAGQLAFDDIKLYDGKCLGEPQKPTKFDCGGGELIDYSLVCDFKIDCSTKADELNCGSCDFEDPNLCGWKDNSTGRNKWIRTRNQSMSNFTGPSIDHTLGDATGYYMNLITRTEFQTSQPGYLVSPKLPRASSTCQLKFWLTTIGSPTIYVDIYINGKKEGRLFRSSTSTSNRANWTEVVIDLG